MTELTKNQPHLSPDFMYECGIREGLEIAARIVDRHSALQQHYADVCEDAMPNSAHAFVLQKIVATRMAEEIRQTASLNHKLSKL